MKHLFKTLCLLVLILSGFESKASLTAFFSYANFSTASHQHYVETYLSVVGRSVKFTKNKSGKYQAAIEISIAFVKDDQIKNYNKYNLLSTEIEDSTSMRPNFLDVQRYVLENGNYILELEIKDKAVPGKVFKSTQPLVVNFPTDSVAFSSVELLEGFAKTETPNVLTKSGYDMVPYVSTYYGSSRNEFTFYTEFYNSANVLGKDVKYSFVYYLESFEDHQKIMEYGGLSKQSAAEVNVLLGKLDISKLPSGNYNLVVEARDRLNTVLQSERVFFQRNNPAVGMTMADISNVEVENTFVTQYKNKDSLMQHIRTMRPLSSENEWTFAENQLKMGDTKQMQQYFLAFWKKRNPHDPEKAWLDYKKDVDYVNQRFGSASYPGYTTDRGRVYLQYGEPDSRTVFDSEPSSYPYEVWQYYKLEKRTNRKFVFGNFALAGNNYKLIHSDAVGEIKDARWQQRLVKRNQQRNDFDVEKSNDYYGGNMDDNFNNPR